MRKTLLTIMGGALLWAANAQAQQVEFDANVNSTCSITVIQNGILVPNADARMLSTNTAGGGVRGEVQIQTNANGFRVSSSVPTAFAIKPAADTTPTTFMMINTASGATNSLPSINSTPIALNPGTTTYHMTLIANKTPGQSFANGAYRAISTVTCE